MRIFSYLAGIVKTPSASADNVIQPTGAAVTPFIAKGAAAQTANLQEWQDSSGTQLGHFAANGRLVTTANLFGKYGTAAEGGIGDFGPSSESALKLGGDAVLFRSAADTFKTVDKMLVGSLGVGNSAAATTLGTVTKKMEVFDASGASLGFVPIYDAIT